MKGGRRLLRATTGCRRLVASHNNPAAAGAGGKDGLRPCSATAGRRRLIGTHTKPAATWTGEKGGHRHHRTTTGRHRLVAIHNKPATTRAAGQGRPPPPRHVGCKSGPSPGGRSPEGDGHWRGGKGRASVPPRSDWVPPADWIPHQVGGGDGRQSTGGGPPLGGVNGGGPPDQVQPLPQDVNAPPDRGGLPLAGGRVRAAARRCAASRWRQIAWGRGTGGVAAAGRSCSATSRRHPHTFRGQPPRMP